MAEMKRLYEKLLDESISGLSTLPGEGFDLEDLADIDAWLDEALLEATNNYWEEEVTSY